MSNTNPPFQTQANFCKVLAHPTRLAILAILRDGEQCVCHLEAMLDLRQANISQHLMTLREAGLVMDRRDGWNIYYRVIRPEVFILLDALTPITGQPEPIPHVHAESQCPCPKCDGEDDTSPSSG
jgi:DNA-binding transcriptional ArsR family regulator